MFYIIQQTDDENIHTYQVEVVILIEQKTVITNLQGNVEQLEGRNNNQILGVKGLNSGFQGNLRKRRSKDEALQVWLIYLFIWLLKINIFPDTQITLRDCHVLFLTNFLKTAGPTFDYSFR